MLFFSYMLPNDKSKGEVRLLPLQKKKITDRVKSSTECGVKNKLSELC